MVWRREAGTIPLGKRKARWCRSSVPGKDHAADSTRWPHLADRYSRRSGSAGETVDGGGDTLGRQRLAGSTPQRDGGTSFIAPRYLQSCHHRGRPEYIGQRFISDWHQEADIPASRKRGVLGHHRSQVRHWRWAALRYYEGQLEYCQESG